MEVDVAGHGDFAIDVVGVSQYQDVLKAAVAQGAIVRASIVLEDTNPYDDQAVAVQLDGRRVGYLSRARARVYRADLAAAGGDSQLIVRCMAKIVGGFTTPGGNRAHFGLKLHLPKLSG
jgi:hypothetical protein